MNRRGGRLDARLPDNREQSRGHLEWHVRCPQSAGNTTSEWQQSSLGHIASHSTPFRVIRINIAPLPETKALWLCGGNFRYQVARLLVVIYFYFPYIYFSFNLHSSLRQLASKKSFKFLSDPFIIIRIIVTFIFISILSETKFCFVNQIELKIQIK